MRLSSRLQEKLQFLCVRLALPLAFGANQVELIVRDTGTGIPNRRDSLIV